MRQSLEGSDTLCCDVLDCFSNVPPRLLARGRHEVALARNGVRGEGGGCSRRRQVARQRRPREQIGGRFHSINFVAHGFPVQRHRAAPRLYRGQTERPGGGGR